MPPLAFFTVDVFTEARFGGNPLAVVINGDTLDVETMQALACEFNLSETTFVQPPANPDHTARLRIFNRVSEMAFAGHPIVGTAFVLAAQQPDLHAATIEVPAGIVRVRIDRDDHGLPTGAGIVAPQPLTIGGTVAPELVARALRLAASDVITTRHLPTVASNGNAFVFAELTGDALPRCDPDMAAFRTALDAHPELGIRLALHVYTKTGHTLRTRMFSPLSGTWEDPATGSANTSLSGLLLSLTPDADVVSFEIHQGVEMGRPSLLHVEARRSPEGIVGTLSGSCVSVMRGTIDL